MDKQKIQLMGIFDEQTMKLAEALALWENHFSRIEGNCNQILGIYPGEPGVMAVKKASLSILHALEILREAGFLNP